MLIRQAVKKTLSILIFAFTSFAAIPGLTQAVYTNTDETIYKLTGKAGTSERTEIHNECGVDHLLSIAVFQDTIYYTTWTGELKRFRIGVPGSAETLLTNAGFFNALTVDKNGILYMAAELLVRFDPHTRQLTNLGLMPFTSGGDMIFYRDKLLMAGFNPYTLSTGIYEIDVNDVTQSTLYMDAPDFIGLMAYPASCGHNRYFGLSAESDGTRLTEIDLLNKQIINSNFRFADALLDAASTAELGLEDGIEVTSVKRTMSDNCINGNGSISLQASTLNGPVHFTLLNTNQTQASGAFFNLRGGLYQFRLYQHTNGPQLVSPQNVVVGLGFALH